MKYVFLLLLSISAWAQQGKAIISLDKDNIVYRGIDNPLKIGVPGVAQRDVKVSASGGSISPIDGQPGYYKWNVTSASGTTAIITVTYKEPDGKTKMENKEFRIMPLPDPYAYIENQKNDSKQQYYLTRKKIADIKLNTTIDTYHEHGDAYYKVVGFWLYLPKDTIGIEGNTIPDSIKTKIQSLQTGSTIIIDDIRRYVPPSTGCLLLKGLPPITIEVVDEPLPITQDDLPSPVIYNTRYETVYRGMDNHFSISVPNAKSYTVNGPGVKQYHDSFDINIPADYKEERVFVDVEAVIKTDSVVNYQYMYIVKSFEIRALINGQGCEKCIVEQTLKELEKAKISVSLPDIKPFNIVLIKSFVVTLPNGNTIKVEGDTMSNEAHFFIEQFTKPGDIITIDDIRYRVPGVCEMYPAKHPPIKIIITE